MAMATSRIVPKLVDEPFIGGGSHHAEYEIIPRPLDPVKDKRAPLYLLDHTERYQEVAAVIARQVIRESEPYDCYLRGQLYTTGFVSMGPKTK